MADQKETNTDYREEFAYQARIKNVHIELPNYAFRHSPMDSSDDPLFVGRKKAKQFLLNFLRRGENSGAYLITGYRGMGKTSLVNSVVNQFVKEAPKHKKVKVSFGQKDIQEIDVLRQLVSEIKFALKSEGRVKRYLNNWWILFGVLLLLIWSFIYTGLRCDDFTFSGITNNIIVFLKELTTTPEQKNWASYSFLYLGVALCFLFAYLFHRWRGSVNKKISAYFMANNLLERIQSSITTEVGASGDLNERFLNITNKKTKVYPIASPKEVSNELIRILHHVSDKIHFIVIFDELDKIEPITSKVTYYEGMDSFIAKNSGTTTIFDQRERKLRVLEILSSLKYLITEGKARFIFIAGSEMFDAALADIADRQSALSSIFNQIINVDSLLKDKSEVNLVGTGVTNMIEEYLFRLILPDNSSNKVDSKPFLQQLYEKIIEKKSNNQTLISETDAYKVIYTLQHFIIYVTYRSNGSPKKMIKIIEDHCISIDRTTISGKQNKNLKNIYVSYNKYAQDWNAVYLSLSYNDQYKIGLLSYIFRPIIITKSRTLKQYSDSLLIATPYLLDHLLKFHSFAFSLEHLELMPEVLSSNRSPELRFFLEEMVQWMKQNLIRDTENGFFEYKFLHKIFYEISYISKISDEESAAFNFTLDENYSVKLHIRVKIKELRSIYKDYGGDDTNSAISSLAFMNTMLGDAHYFDQEYSDAIVAYSDALRMTQYAKNGIPRKHATNIALNQMESAYLPEQSYFMLSVKCMMKLGLIYEKMKSYDMALAYYYDTLLIISKVCEHNRKGDSSAQIFSSYRKTIINAIFAVLHLLEKKENSIGDDHLKLNKVIEKIDPKKEWLLKSPEFLLNFAKLEFHRGTTNHVSSSMILSSLRKLFENKPETVELKLYPYLADNALFFAFCALEKEKSRWESSNEQEPNNTGLGNQHIYIKLILIYKKLIKDPEFYKNEVEAYSKLGKNIAFIGDVMYSYYNYSKKPKLAPPSILKFKSTTYSDKNEIEEWLSDIEKNSSIIIDDESPYLTQLNLVFYSYLLSAVLLHRSNEHNLASAQYNKILGILRFHASNLSIESDTLKFLEQSIVKRMLEVASWNSGSSDRPQVYKFKQYFGVDDIHHPQSMSKYNYLNVSNAAELKEALINFAALKLIVQNTSNTSKLKIFTLKDYKNIPEQALITPSNGIYTQYSRLNELGLQCVINRSLLIQIYTSNVIWKKNGPNLFKCWINSYYKISKQSRKTDIQIENIDILNYGLEKFFNIFENLPNTNNEKSLLEDFPYLIANWIFCIHNILNILKTMGDSFLFAHSNIADYHRRYAEILKYYELCRWLKHFDIIKTDIDDELNKLVGFKPLGNVDSTSEFQQAGRHYYKAIRTHNGGEEYRYMITNLYYLEDDFSDVSFLFSIAFERQRLRSGQIKNLITEIRKDVGESQLFKYDSYANTRVE